MVHRWRWGFVGPTAVTPSVHAAVIPKPWTCTPLTSSGIIIIIIIIVTMTI